MLVPLVRNGENISRGIAPPRCLVKFRLDLKNQDTSSYDVPIRKYPIEYYTSEEYVALVDICSHLSR